MLPVLQIMAALEHDTDGEDASPAPKSRASKKKPQEDADFEVWLGASILTKHMFLSLHMLAASQLTTLSCGCEHSA